MPIAADGFFEFDARPTLIGAGITRFDDEAVCGATVAVFGIAVVADFVAFDDAVATRFGRGLQYTCPRRAIPAIFDGAFGRASIAIVGIAVVAFFSTLTGAVATNDRPRVRFGIRRLGIGRF